MAFGAIACGNAFAAISDSPVYKAYYNDSYNKCVADVSTVADFGKIKANFDACKKGIAGIAPKIAYVVNINADLEFSTDELLSTCKENAPAGARVSDQILFVFGHGHTISGLCAKQGVFGTPSDLYVDSLTISNSNGSATVASGFLATTISGALDVYDTKLNEVSVTSSGYKAGLYAASVGGSFNAARNVVTGGSVISTSTTEAYVGGLVGSINGDANLDNMDIGVMMNVESITQSSYVGGVFGVNDDTTSRVSINNVKVNANNILIILPATNFSATLYTISVGGLVGRLFNDTTSITNCSSEGEIKLSSSALSGLPYERHTHVGGLVGSIPLASSVSVSGVSSEAKIDVNGINSRLNTLRTNTFEDTTGYSSVGGLFGLVEVPGKTGSLSFNDISFDGSIDVNSPNFVGVGVGGAIGRIKSLYREVEVELSNVNINEGLLKAELYSGYVGGVVGMFHEPTLVARDIKVKRDVKGLNTDNIGFRFSNIKVGGVFGLILNANANLKNFKVTGEVGSEHVNPSSETSFYTAVGGIAGGIINNSVKESCASTIVLDSMLFEGKVKAKKTKSNAFVGGLVGIEMHLTNTKIMNSVAKAGTDGILLDVYQDTSATQRVSLGGLVGLTLGYASSQLGYIGVDNFGTYKIDGSYAEGVMKFKSYAKNLNETNGSPFISGIKGYVEAVEADSIMNSYYRGNVDVGEMDISYGTTGLYPNFINVRGVLNVANASGRICNVYAYIVKADTLFKDLYSSNATGLVYSTSNVFLVKDPSEEVTINSKKYTLASQGAVESLNSSADADYWYYDASANSGLPMLLYVPNGKLADKSYLITFIEGSTTVLEAYTDNDGKIAYNKDGSALDETSLPEVFGFDYSKKQYTYWKSTDTPATIVWDGNTTFSSDVTFNLASENFPTIKFVDEAGNEIATDFQYWNGDVFNVSTSEKLPTWIKKIDGAYYSQNNWAVGTKVVSTRDELLEHIAANQLTSPVNLVMENVDSKRVRTQVTLKLENVAGATIDVSILENSYTETLTEGTNVLPRMTDFKINNFDKKLVTTSDSVEVTIGVKVYKVCALSEEVFTIPTGVTEATISFVEADTAVAVDTTKNDTAVVDTSKNDTAAVDTSKNDTAAVDTSVTDTSATDTIATPEDTTGAKDSLDNSDSLNVPVDDPDANPGLDTNTVDSVTVVVMDKKACEDSASIKKASVELAGTAALFSIDLDIPQGCNMLKPQVSIKGEGVDVLDTVLPSVSKLHNIVKYPLDPGSYTFSVNLTSKKAKTISKTVKGTVTVYKNTWMMKAIASWDDKSISKSDAYMFKWDADIEQGEYLQYVEIESLSEVKEQEGYWIRSSKSQEVPLKLPLKKAEGKDVSWNLKYNYNGWNMLANPYSWNIYAGSVDAFKSAESSDAPIWRWNALKSKYEVSDTLYANDAFWIETDAARTLTVSNEPVFKTPTTLKKASLRKAQTKKSWSMTLVASDNSGSSDVWNVFGIGSKKVEISDPPSSMGDGLNVAFVSESGKSLAKRIVASSDAETEGYTWNLKISGASEGKVKLTLEGLDEVRSFGYRAVLVIDGKAIEWGDKSSITVNASSNAKTALLKVVPEQAEVTVAKGVRNLNFNVDAGRIAVQFTVNSEDAGAITSVRLLDLKGSVLSNSSAKASSGTNVMNVNAPVKSGVYILQVKVGRESKAVRLSL